MEVTIYGSRVGDRKDDHRAMALSFEPWGRPPKIIEGDFTIEVHPEDSVENPNS